MMQVRQYNIVSLGGFCVDSQQELCECTVLSMCVYARVYHVCDRLNMCNCSCLHSYAQTPAVEECRQVAASTFAGSTCPGGTD